MSSAAKNTIPAVNVEALKSEVRQALVNSKAFACPIAARVAWHASGTYSVEDGTGGSDGATMRFEPEKSDPANAGLHIVRDMLHQVKKAHPEISEADLWTFAGCVSVEFMGGPVVPHRFGRTDKADGSHCPPVGRIPDASKGADHVREFFRRMGFNDRETVALCGAHTVGRAHVVRSGFDGPWTHNPLQFDNSYFKNLMHLEWKVKEWDGNFQYTDVATESLLMLPSDMALKTDPGFRQYAELYARDQDAFFKDFSYAFAKLMALGCPDHCDPHRQVSSAACPAAERGAKFREYSMHGSVGAMRGLADKCDVHAVEASTGRTALHKAAFWGHIDAVRYLLAELKLNVNAVDVEGDTALHDAARFGHTEVVRIILAHKPDVSIRNNAGHDALDIAIEYQKPEIVDLLRARSKL